MGTHAPRTDPDGMPPQMHEQRVKYGEYWLCEKIGDGGFAEVFIATGSDNDAPPVVIKRLFKHLEEYPQN